MKLKSGHSSGGRAQASQAWGRGFESRCPLQRWKKFSPPREKVDRGVENLLGVKGEKARSSGGERYLDAVEVGGSKPPVPTRGCMSEEGSH